MDPTYLAPEERERLYGVGKHLTDAELQAEWARAAYVVAVFGGPFSWGRHTDTLHRFLTTPHA